MSAIPHPLTAAGPIVNAILREMGLMVIVMIMIDGSEIGFEDLSC